MVESYYKEELKPLVTLLENYWDLDAENRMGAEGSRLMDKMGEMYPKLEMSSDDFLKLMHEVNLNKSLPEDMFGKYRFVLSDVKDESGVVTGFKANLEKIELN